MIRVADGVMGLCMNERLGDNIGPDGGGEKGGCLFFGSNDVCEAC